MKISEMIEALNKIMSKYGDIECVHYNSEHGIISRICYSDCGGFDSDDEFYSSISGIEEYGIAKEDLRLMCIIS